MKVVDILKERNDLQLQYFTAFGNPFVELVERSESQEERKRIKDRLIKQYRSTEAALKRYLELSDRLHESNTRTYIDIQGYCITVQTALEILANADAFVAVMHSGKGAVLRKTHPMMDFVLNRVHRDVPLEEQEYLDPLHLCGDPFEQADPVMLLQAELRYGIMKSNCETEI